MLIRVLSGVSNFEKNVCFPFSETRTAFTEVGEDGSARRRDDRPVFLVSSTSWTGLTYISFYMEKFVISLTQLFTTCLISRLSYGY